MQDLANIWYKKTGRPQEIKLKLSELIKRIKLPAKASIYYLAASTAGKIVSFVITPFTTRLLGKENFGQFSLYMALLGGVSVICSAFTSSSAVYKGMQNFGKKSGYLISVLWVSIAYPCLSAHYCLHLYHLQSWRAIFCCLLRCKFCVT